MSMTGICADIYLGTYDDSGVMNKAEQMNLANKKVKALEFDGQAAEAALAKAKSYTEKFETAPSLAEIKRLEKLAIAALEAMPNSDNESRNKRKNALSESSSKLWKRSTRLHKIFKLIRRKRNGYRRK